MFSYAMTTKILSTVLSPYAVAAKILSMEGQAAIFLTTVAAGFAIGFIFDIFRIIRKITPNNVFLTQIEDILFWLIVSLGMFYIMLNQTFGQIRAFNVLGAFLGMVVYSQTLSVIFMAASSAIINFIKKAIAALIKLVCMPFRFLIRILKKPAGFITKLLRKQSNKLIKLLRKIKNYVRIKIKDIKRDIKIIIKKA